MATSSRHQHRPAKNLIVPHADAPRHFGNVAAYATLAFGSALALFLYPHSITGVLSANSRNVIKRNAALLPAYSLPARTDRAAGLHGRRGRRQGQAAVRRTVQAVRRQLRRARAVPETLPGVVRRASRSPPSPSARSCPRRSCRSRPPTCSHATSTRNTSPPTPPTGEEAQHGEARLAGGQARRAALHHLPAPQYAIQLQLLGGVWIIQTLPAVVVGLYTRWFHRRRS